MSYSILIAEDDLSIAELIRLSLQSSGYTCHKALTGTGALEAVKQKDFHLALLDVMLPDIDGYAILAALSQKNIPAIFVTAKTGVLDKVHGLRLGAPKPTAVPSQSTANPVAARKCRCGFPSIPERKTLQSVDNSPIVP